MVLKALTQNIPPAADQKSKTSRKALVYSESEKEWIGPFKVIRREEITVIVYNRNGRKPKKTFNAFQLKPFYHGCAQNHCLFSSGNQLFSNTAKIHFTKKLQPYDLTSLRFPEAVQKEIEGLKNKQSLEFFPDTICCFQLML